MDHNVMMMCYTYIITKFYFFYFILPPVLESQSPEVIIHMFVLRKCTNELLCQSATSLTRIGMNRVGHSHY